MHGSSGTSSLVFAEAFFNLSTVEIEAKRRYLLEVRDRLVYDLSGGRRDAFSLLMDGVRIALPRLGAVVPSGVSGDGFHLSLGALMCDSTPRMGEFRPLPEELSSGVGKEKAWTHTFGELSCRSAISWKAPSSLRNSNSLKGSRVYPSILEQFVLARMVRAIHGTSVSLRALLASPMAKEQESAVLNSALFAVCTHFIFPHACHDIITVGDHGGVTCPFPGTSWKENCQSFLMN